MANNSAYKPYEPARRPGGKPDDAPTYRLVVHRKYAADWEALAGVVGAQNAQRAWDHLANHPGQTPQLGQCSKLKGMAKFATGGWSAIYHYEASSAARINYQFHQGHVATEGQEPVPVTRILSIDLNHNVK